METVQNDSSVINIPDEQIATAVKNAFGYNGAKVIDNNQGCEGNVEARWLVKNGNQCSYIGIGIYTEWWRPGSYGFRLTIGSSPEAMGNVIEGDAYYRFAQSLINSGAVAELAFDGCWHSTDKGL